MSTHEKEESPLLNVLVNVFLPVMVLSKMSKMPGYGEAAKFYYVGPHKALMIAVLIPFLYGLYHFIKKKEFNIFSAVGLLSVVLTGGVTLYLWNADGSVKPDAALWFGMKEAIQPLIIGLIVLVSHRTKSPLFREFVYNKGIFDVERIEFVVGEANKEEDYQKVIFRNTLYFCGTFALSAVLNLVLAMRFLGALDFTADNAQELYNQGVAKVTGWGFLVIGLPLLVISSFIIMNLLKDLGRLTGLKKEEILLIGS